MNYERHFLSACWPDITGEEYEHLKDSIHVSGLREAITLYEGQILDGWNRYRACNDMAMPAHYVEFEGAPEDAEQFVRDKHNRRSLTLTQRMACEAKMSVWPGRGGDRSAEKQSAPSALCSKNKQNRTDLAKKTGGSVRTAQQVINVVKSGNEEAIDAMVQGKLSAKAAEAKVKGKVEPRKATPIRPEYSEADQMADKLKEAHHAIDEMQKEITALKDGILTEGDLDAKELIGSLRAEIKLKDVELNAIKSQRDLLMSENHELKKQCGMYMKKLKLAA